MLSTVSNFFNTSIAALSIYDIFVIILFTLAIVLSIVSGVIIVATRVKKINVELEKSKNIQNINERIIQNRLDLIINKLNNTDIYNKNQHFLPVNNLNNNGIKQAINATSAEVSEKSITTTPNVIELPSPKAIDSDSNQAANGFDIVQEPGTPYSKETIADNTINQPMPNISTPTAIKTNTDETITTTIPIVTPGVPSNFNKADEIVVNKPETIVVNTDNVPEVDSTLTKDDNAIIIDIKDTSEKPYEIEIDNSPNSNEDASKPEKGFYDKGQSIPLKSQTKDDDFLFESTDENSLEGDLAYGENNIDLKESKEDLAGIGLANKILNELEVFSDDEKFEITDNITKDGDYINCLVRNKYLPLDYKELNRQLLIQRLVDQYYYPLDLIEVSYPLVLKNGLTKKADIIVFDDNNNSYIVAIIATPNKKKRFKLLKKLVKAANIPFAIWTDGTNIMYYQYIDGSLEEISDLPEYNENIDITINDKSTRAQFISQPKAPFNYTPPFRNMGMGYKDQNFVNQAINNNSTFAKDSYNIYRKNPYTLSNDYQAIIAKYKNLKTNSGGYFNEQLNNMATVRQLPPQMGNAYYPTQVNVMPSPHFANEPLPQATNTINPAYHSNIPLNFTRPNLAASINIVRNNSISGNPNVPYNISSLKSFRGNYMNMNRPSNFNANLPVQNINPNTPAMGINFNNMPPSPNINHNVPPPPNPFFNAGLQDSKFSSGFNVPINKPAMPPINFNNPPVVNNLPFSEPIPSNHGAPVAPFNMSNSNSPSFSFPGNAPIPSNVPLQNLPPQPPQNFNFNRPSASLMPQNSFPMPPIGAQVQQSMPSGPVMPPPPPMAMGPMRPAMPSQHAPVNSANPNNQFFGTNNFFTPNNGTTQQVSEPDAPSATRHAFKAYNEVKANARRAISTKQNSEAENSRVFNSNFKLR